MNSATATPTGAFDISAKTSNPNAGLRGNYSRMAADYTVQQNMADYSAAEQARWLRLVERQLAHQHARHDRAVGADRDVGQHP